METKPDFNLEDQIQQWRTALAATGPLTEANVEELEHHLRDSIVALRAHHLSEEESFWVASRRLGQADGLREEFTKTNTAAVWQTRLGWILVGGILTQVWMSLQTLCWQMSLSLLNSQLSSHGVGLLHICSTWLCLLGFFFTFRFIVAKPRLMERLQRGYTAAPWKAGVGSAGIVGLVYFLPQLPYFLSALRTVASTSSDLTTTKITTVSWWSVANGMLIWAVLVPVALALVVSRSRRDTRSRA